MIAASQLRAGMAVRFEGHLYKILAADYHPGQGKMGGVNHARLRNLDTGTLWEHSFRADLKLEEVPLGKAPMQYLYQDAGQCCFMDPETFEQVSVEASLIGEQARLLRPEMRVTVETLGERPISVLLPDIMEVRVEHTAPPAHAQVDSVWKPARLDGGVEVMVPQFIKTGETIRLDVANLKYMERAKAAKGER